MWRPASGWAGPPPSSSWLRRSGQAFQQDPQVQAELRLLRQLPDGALPLLVR